jgi:hypothetical protein
LTIQHGFIQLPDGTPVLFFSPVYCGPLEAGERALAPLRAAGRPLADQIQPVAYDAVVHATDALVPKGRHYYIQTRSLAGLRAETIEALVDSAHRLTAPSPGISIHHFHGAASRVSASETAFAPRRDHLLVEIVAGWEPRPPEADDALVPQVRWAQDTSRALAPHALPGGYINLLDRTEQERVRLAYGPNYERLRELKREYDPDDVFRSAVGHIALTDS